jgi:hypothetical protein
MPRPFLLPIFAEAGATVCQSLLKLHTDLLLFAPVLTNDAAWAQVYEALVNEFEPERLDNPVVSRLDPLEADERREVLRKLHDHFSDPLAGVKLVLQITDEVIESRPKTRPAKLASEAQWAYLEALLWRQRDGLEAIILLHPKGLHAEVSVTLGCVTEAGLLFDVVWLDPTRPDDLTKKALGYDVKTLEELIEHDRARYGSAESDIQKLYVGVVKRLKDFGHERVFDTASGKFGWVGNGPGKSPRWKELANDPLVAHPAADDLLYQIFGEKGRHRAFFHTFIQRDGFAHSLPDFLTGWASIDNGALKISGRIRGENPIPLHNHTYLTLSRYMVQLNRLRPELGFDYGRLLNTAWREANYRQKRSPE